MSNYTVTLLQSIYLVDDGKKTKYVTVAPGHPTLSTCACAATDCEHIKAVLKSSKKEDEAKSSRVESNPLAEILESIDALVKAKQIKSGGLDPEDFLRVRMEFFNTNLSMASP